MSIAPAADIVRVWTEHGTPARLVWRGHRYRVVGGEPIRSAIAHEALTHAASRLVGWSLIARAEHDPAYVHVWRLQRQGAGWVLVDLDPA